MRSEVTFMRSQLAAEQQAKLALEDQMTSEIQVNIFQHCSYCGTL